MPDAERDPLEELRERVKATTEAAERIMAERAPRSGWAAPPPAAGEAQSEMQALIALLESLRDMLPPELRTQVTELVRQLLLVLRALIDWLAGQPERGRRGG